MDVTHIHFVGVKGVGMAPLAVIAKEAGFVVTGSDILEKYITQDMLESKGIMPKVGFSPEHIQKADLIITTGAHGGFNNPEVVAATKKGIPVWTQGKAVGEFMKGDIFNRSHIGISIAGCHGKTTTTALVATILKKAGESPSWVIGTGDIPSLGFSGHFGDGVYFVAEADEYASEPKYERTPKFLLQHPKVAIITNIEYDHPDLYPTFQSLVNAYEQFMTQVLSEGGIVIACGDDWEIAKIAKKIPGIITFGKGVGNTYILSDVQSSNGQTQFVIARKEEDFFCTIPFLGEHNAYNASAAFAAADILGISPEKIQKGLLAFSGTKRRLEYLGTTKSGLKIYDDYAHHPTEIRASLQALRANFPSEYIICAFQPHTFSRTKLLFKEFATAFTDANEVVLVDIFPSAREDFDSSISSLDLAQEVQKHSQVTHYIASLGDVIEYLGKKQLEKRSILVTMGAGDIYQVAYALTEK